MFVPLGDDNPLKTIPFQYVTVMLIVLNILIFIGQTAGNVDPSVLASFAVVPNQLLHAGLVGGGTTGIDTILVPERATLVSYMFLHADPLHLAGNMIFLWVFGDNIEDAMGHARFLVFYLACGIVAALFHAIMLPESSDALIGASGAVSGVVAAYLILHPRVRVWVLALKVIPLRITAAWVLGAWILFQFVMALVPQPLDTAATAWWAHIGGILAGALLLPLLRRRGIPILDRSAREN